MKFGKLTCATESSRYGFNPRRSTIPVEQIQDEMTAFKKKWKKNRNEGLRTVARGDRRPPGNLGLYSQRQPGRSRQASVMSLNYVIMTSAAASASLARWDFLKDLQTGRSPNILLWILVTLRQIGFNSVHQFAQRFESLLFANHFGGQVPQKCSHEV